MIPVGRAAMTLRRRDVSVEVEKAVGMTKDTSKTLLDKTVLSWAGVTHKTAGVAKHGEKKEQVAPRRSREPALSQGHIVDDGGMEVLPGHVCDLRRRLRRILP